MMIGPPKPRLILKAAIVLAVTKGDVQKVSSWHGPFSPFRSLNVGALIIRIGFPLKGSFNGVYKGSVVGFFSIGALIIRIGCGGP